MFQIEGIRRLYHPSRKPDEFSLEERASIPERVLKHIEEARTRAPGQSARSTLCNECGSFSAGHRAARPISPEHPTNNTDHEGDKATNNSSMRSRSLIRIPSSARATAAQISSGSARGVASRLSSSNLLPNSTAALFLNGRWNNVIDNTKVWRLKSCCTKSSDQLVYYSARVGVLANTFREECLGSGSTKRPLVAYEWLVEHYEADAQVFIFGFSGSPRSAIPKLVD